MAYPQEPQQPYQPTDLRPHPHQYQVQHPQPTTFPPAAVATAPAVPQSAPEPTQSDPYALGAWGSALRDVVCPSGQRAALRKPQIEALISAGLLDKINVLAGVADGQIWTAQGLPPIKVDAILRDPNRLGHLVELMDAVLVMAVAAPAIRKPINEQGEFIPMDRREPGVGYTDMVDFTDKVFIFTEYTSQISAGAPFPGAAGEHSERLAHEPGAAVSAEQPVRAE